MKTKRAPARAAVAPALHPAEQYIQDVLSGKVVVNKWVKLAVERQQNDLARAAAGDPSFPYRFDPERAKRSIRFYKLCRHSKGEWAGKIISPAPWQQFIDWVVFGWVRVADGTRRFRRVYEEIARKNGKTTRQAKNGIYLTVADGEDGSEVYVGATKLKQAMGCFEEARRMVRKSPTLKKMLNVLKLNISDPENWSKFEPLGADSEKIDGLNVHGGIIDELHAHKSREMYDLLDTATGARRQPLLWSISTAGKVKKGICWEKRQYTIQVLTGMIKDETFFGIIFCIDEGDDPFNEAVWIKANPNLGVSVKLEFLREQATLAKNSNIELSKFLRLHLGVWCGEVDTLISERVWAQNGDKPNLDQLIRERAPCYVTFDLSSKIDLSALVLTFPPHKGRRTFDVIPMFWTPADSVHDAERPNRESIRAWVEAGYILTTPGRSIKQRYIFRVIKELKNRGLRIREVLGDEWNASYLIDKLIDDLGLVVTVFGQNMKNYTGPTKKLLTILLEKRMRHGMHPVLAEHATNLAVLTDTHGNMMPTKKKSAGKIDGSVSLIMGIGGWMTRHVPKQPGQRSNPNRNCDFTMV